VRVRQAAPVDHSEVDPSRVHADHADQPGVAGAPAESDVVAVDGLQHVVGQLRPDDLAGADGEFTDIGRGGGEQ
jgi:hypothetical protein